MAIYHESRTWHWLTFLLAVIGVVVTLQISFISERQSHCIDTQCGLLPDYLSVYHAVPEELLPRVRDDVHSTTRPASFEEALKLATIVNKSNSIVLSWTSYSHNGTLIPWVPSILFSSAVRTGLSECSYRLTTLQESTLSSLLICISISTVAVSTAIPIGFSKHRFSVRTNIIPGIDFVPAVLSLCIVIIVMELHIRISDVNGVYVPSIPLCNVITDNVESICNIVVDSSFSIRGFISQSVRGSLMATKQTATGLVELIVFPVVFFLFIVIYGMSGRMYFYEEIRLQDGTIGTRRSSLDDDL